MIEFKIVLQYRGRVAIVFTFFLVPHRRIADPRCMKLWYNACALSAQRSVFSLVREARFLVGPEDLEHPYMGASMSRTKCATNTSFFRALPRCDERGSMDS